MRPGVYRGLANDSYHRGPGISKSGLDLIRKSPAHYRAVVTAANDNERAPTLAQFIGTALHMAVLEPELFARTYTLALQRSDVPHAIDDREQLVAMVAKLNEGRKAKLSTSGSKAELAARIAESEEFTASNDGVTLEMLNAETGALLKQRIERINTGRTGLLPASGSRHDLAEILRANCVEVTLWSDVQAEWLRNNGERTILSAEQFEQVRNMRDAIMAHPAASKLLSAPGESELSAYWTQTVVDPLSGEVIGEQLCRVRPDYWRHDGILVDLKTTEDASGEEFARSIAKWAYHVQDDYYQHGVGEALRQGGVRVGDVNPVTAEITFQEDPAVWAMPRAFVFIAVEKTACVVDGRAKGVAVYRLDEESRALGRHQWQRDLATYTRCEVSGVWPGYADGIKQIKLPAWQFQRAAAAAAE